MDNGDNSRDHSNERRHFSSNVQSLSGIAGGGQMTVGVDDAAMIREYGFEKRHFEQANGDDEETSIDDFNQDGSENHTEPLKVHFQNVIPDHGDKAAGLSSGIGQMTAGSDHWAMTRDHDVEKKHFEDDGEKTLIKNADSKLNSSENKLDNAPKIYSLDGISDGVIRAAGGDYGAVKREHGFERKHFEQADDYDEKPVETGYAYQNFSEKKPNSAAKVHSLSGIAGGGQMTAGVDDEPMIREHGFGKKHFEQADDYDEKPFETPYAYENFSEKKPNSAAKVQSLSGITGGGQMTVGVDDGPMIREHGFEKRHYEQADDYDQGN